MPLDNAEKIEDSLRALGIGNKLLALASNMPPVTPARPRKVSDFAPVFTLVATDILPLVDQIIEDIKD